VKIALALLLLFAPLTVTAQLGWTPKHFWGITGIGVPLDIGAHLLLRPTWTNRRWKVVAEVGAFEGLQMVVQNIKQKWFYNKPMDWDAREVVLPVVGAATLEYVLVPLVKKVFR